MINLSIIIDLWLKSEISLCQHVYISRNFIRNKFNDQMIGFIINDKVYIRGQKGDPILTKIISGRKVSIPIVKIQANNPKFFDIIRMTLISKLEQYYESIV